MPRIAHDLWQTRPGRWLLRRPWFPVALQVLAAAAMAALAVNGWGDGAGEPASRLLLLRKTHLTTLVVWGLWWPTMIAAALLLGRAWCTACPMELVARAGGWLARGAGWGRRALPALLRAGWATVGAYLLLQLLVAGVSLHRVPHYTSLLLLAFGAIALASGLLFSDPRAFCKAFCPASALLSVYGRHAPVQLDVRSPAVCDDCSTRDCVRAAHRDRLDRRSCPSALRPFARHPSDPCTLCFQCAKVCPRGNVGFGVTSPGAAVRAPSALRPAEAAFVFIAAGFVAHEVIGEVRWVDAIFHRLPGAIAGAVPGLPFAWVEPFWFLCLFPLAFAGVVIGAARALGHRGGLRELLVWAATGAAPIIAVAHLAKAASKLLGWVGYLPLAVADPGGLESLRQLETGARAAPAPLVELPVVGAFVALLLAIVALRSLRARHAPDAAPRSARLAGLAVAGTLFGAVLVTWIAG